MFTYIAAPSQWELATTMQVVDIMLEATSVLADLLYYFKNISARMVNVFSTEILRTVVFTLISLAETCVWIHCISGLYLL